MTEPGLVDRQGLLEWVNKAEARSELPRLIRRLILESTPASVQIGMPAEEGIQSRGWDGTVRSPENIRWVPEGLSLWELSTNTKAGQKATSDYSKRLTTPDSSPTSDAAYVALIPRPWTQREEWASIRSHDGRWREVRAYGVDDVITWLEASPATHLWLSEIVGLNPYGRMTAETRWANWRTRTDPPFTHEFVLAGRGQQADDLVERLAGSPSITTISCTSLDEVRAVVAAVAVRADASGEGRLLARMVFVDDLASWRSLIVLRSPLVLVPMRTEFADEVPSDCPHHVVVPLARSDADITVLDIDAGKGASALQAAGIPEDSADALGRLARRSLSALRRSLSVHPELRTPPWASPPVPAAVRAALLAGHFADERDADRQILSDLAGADYETIRQSLVDLSSQDDPLVCLVDGSWHLVSAEDAWLQLSHHLTPDDLQRLARAVDLILGEKDPALELDPENRWQAPLHGKTRRFSDDLRSGLAETVTLLGARGAKVRGPGGCTGADSASYIAGNLLSTANADETGRLWGSLSPMLPLLAEAAPDTFVEAVRVMLRNEVLTEQILGASHTGSTFLSATPPRVGLLWALEVLACSPEYLGAAADVLARLDPISARDRYTSAPSDSLSRIFCVWHPETGATAEQRLEVLDGLRQRHPDCARRLLLSLLPEQGPTQFPIHRPKFRDWEPADEVVTFGDHDALIAEIVDWLIEDASNSEQGWVDLLQPLPFLPQPGLDALVTAFETLAANRSITAEARATLWKRLSSIVQIYRPRSDGDETQPSPILDRLDRIGAGFAPSIALHRGHQLFAEFWPHIQGHSRDDDEEAYDAALAEQRREVLPTIYREHGIEAVQDLSSEASRPWVVSDPLAQIGGHQIDTELLPYLSEAAEERDHLLALNYFTRRFRHGGWQWLDELVSTEELNDHQIALLLLASWDFPRSWERAGSLDSAIAAKYWKLFNPQLGLTMDSPQVEVAAEMLVARQRFGAALMCTHHGHTTGRLESGLAAQLTACILGAFQAAQFIDPEIEDSQDWYSYYITESLNLLRAHREIVGDDTVSRLEWAFLPALEDHSPTILHEQMAKSAPAFVEVIKRVYLPTHRDPTTDVPPSERESVAIQNTYRLLRSWRHVPGTQDDGSIDPQRLSQWIAEARHLLEGADRLNVGDEHIGKVLVKAPSDPDGVGIPVVVRDLLEDIDSPAIRRGIQVELFNRRGATVRAPTAGGEQERAVAGNYRQLANQFANRWPQTAQIYRNLADGYENLARREDDDAERVRQGIWH